MSEQTEKYVRADIQGGYIYNKSEIDYFKQTQIIDVISNLMLGDYNQKGSYMISKEIIEELVKMKKVYQYSFGATTFCQSVNEIGGYGKIDFAIKIRKNTQTGVISATLQVLETIDRANGYYQNTNSASIETYTAKDSSTFIVDMLKYFNVASKREDGLLKKEIQNEEINSIIARKKYEELLKNVSNDKIEAINKDLYFKRMKILDKSSIGKKIKIELESETYKINGWFIKEGMPGYYRYLNQILDGLVEMHSAEALQDVAFTASWRKINDSAAAELKNAFASISKAVQKTAEATNNTELISQINQINNINQASRTGPINQTNKINENKIEFSKLNSEVLQKQEEKPNAIYQTQKVEQKAVDNEKKSNEVDNDLKKVFDGVKREESKEVMNAAKSNESSDLMNGNKATKHEQKEIVSVVKIDENFDLSNAKSKDDTMDL